MAEPILGNFFGIYIGGQRAALAQGKGVSIKTAVVDVTTSDSYGNEEVLPTDHNLSSSIDGLIVAALDNKLQFPEDLSRSAWVKGSGVAVTAFYANDRFGQKHSNRVVWNAGNSVHQEFMVTEANGFVSVDLKGAGEVSIKFLDAADTLSELAVTLTAEWVRYSFPVTAIDFSSECLVVFEKVTGTELQIANVMFNEGEVLADYKGSTYMAQMMQAAQVNKTKLEFRYSNDLTGDSQIAGFGYFIDFQLKTKNAAANGFTATIQGHQIQSVTTI